MARVLGVLLCLLALFSSSLCLDHANGRGDQALAQINVYETSLALDSSVKLHASPQVLGSQVPITNSFIILLFLSDSCLTDIY